MSNQERDCPTIGSSVRSDRSSRGSNKQSVVFLVRSDVKKELERGKRKFEQGDCDGAKLAYERALDLDPGCAIAYFYLGFTFHEMGGLEMAKEYYLQAIDLEKKQSLFLEHLARLHFELEEYSVCLVRFQEAQAVGPLQPISYGLMGRAHYELDRFPEAIGCLERMLEIEPDARLQRIARFYLVLSHLRDGSMLPARKRAVEILGDKECDRLVLSSLADKFQSAGCLSLALAFLDKMRDEPEEVEERIEEIQAVVSKVEARLPKVFTSDEEKLLHHLHFVSQYGTDRIYRVLGSLMELPSALAKEAVVSYCRKYGYPLDQETLGLCLRGEPLIREAALLYLAETFEPEYLALLVENLKHPARDVQMAVARYLERCGHLEHLPALEAHMEISVGAALRRQIQRAINQIKRRHTEQTDKLIHKECQPVRSAAIGSKKADKNLIEWSIAGLVGVYLLFRLVSLFL
jgi:tetratricopeptide (TPR) repeat protein